MIEVLTFFGAINQHKWIPKLWGKLKQIRQEREKELDEINNIVFGDPVELAKYYVEPDCQEMNPADYHEEDRMVLKQPVMVKINEFLKQPTFHQGGNQLFVLSDSGMGKSALLTILKLMHLTKFWPEDRNCVLKKIGTSILDEIQNIKNKRKTILLLDSLDEDPDAYGRVRDRLMEILEASQHFAKVIITCRTQFFPKTEKDPMELPGRVTIGGYFCYSKYISFFDDEKVFQYLSKRFPTRFFDIKGNKRKIDEASKIIDLMGSLRCRPMLLSYIDELMSSPLLEKRDKEYYIYEALMDSWLRREETKKKGIQTKEIYDACLILAVVLQIKQKREISEAELNKLIGEIAKVKAITQIEIKGRSLLNRNSEGNYRFSHYSIQEFCVAKFLSETSLFSPTEKIPVTHDIFQMVATSEKINPEWTNLIQIGQYEDVKIKFTRYNMEFVFVPAGRFYIGRRRRVASILAKLRLGSDQTLFMVILPNGFFLKTTPVTQSQWEAVMGNNPSQFKGDRDRPVESVSWYQAQDFIKKLNGIEGTNKYRLPTEAEWEYACRAGTTTNFSFGDNARKLGEYAWYTANSRYQTHTVGKKKPNAWGLLDMHGNVCEWVEDDWHNNFEFAPNDGRAWIDEPRGALRVVRGGGWNHHARGCGSANRVNRRSDFRGVNLGFRIARSVAGGP